MSSGQSAARRRSELSSHQIINDRLISSRCCCCCWWLAKNVKEFPFFNFNHTQKPSWALLRFLENNRTKRERIALISEHINANEVEVDSRSIWVELVVQSIEWWPAEVNRIVVNSLTFSNSTDNNQKKHSPYHELTDCTISGVFPALLFEFFEKYLYFTRKKRVELRNLEKKNNTHRKS